jgi:hypothetical protein
MARVSRLTLWGLGSSALTALALVNAFTQRANFYAATVYLAKSSGSMMVSCSLRRGTLEHVGRHARLKREQC